MTWWPIGEWCKKTIIIQIIAAQMPSSDNLSPAGFWPSRELHDIELQPASPCKWFAKENHIHRKCADKYALSALSSIYYLEFIAPGCIIEGEYSNQYYIKSSVEQQIFARTWRRACFRLLARQPVLK